ncbi:hypothetical protein ACFFTL_15815, partial [Streptomyces yanii]
GSRTAVSDTSGVPYTVSVRFYDLLQAETDRRLAKPRFADAARRAGHRILDIGAGTGASPPPRTSRPRA